jgi:CRP/FNR family cyclic AMP-dependent transcriptional regulator
MVLGGELFRGLPQTELRRLVAVATRRRFTRREVVFHRGDPAEALHLVLRGRFAARAETETGDRMILSVHGPGDAFGELALLELEQSRSTTVSALEPAETYAVRREDFTRLRQQYPSVNDVLARLLAARIRRMNDLLSEAFSVPADRRVLRRLAELASMYGDDDSDAAVPLSQAELAALAGTSRATVNRVLRAEERRGTVELHRGATLVRDAVALAKRAGGTRDR